MTIYETTYFQDDMPFQSLYKGSCSAAVDAAEEFIIAARSGQHGSPDGVSVRVEKLDESGDGVEEILHIDADE